MEQKAKLIIIGLAVITVTCLFLFIQTFNQKQELVREKNDLKVENTTLSSKIEKLGAALRNYESKITSLNSDLTNISQQKAELENKLELVNSARETLVKKLQDQDAQIVKLKSTGGALAQKLNEQAGATLTPVKETVPLTTDAYWADLLKTKGELDIQLASVRSELKSLQISNEQVQREKSDLERLLNSLKRENEDLKRQIDYNKKLTDSIAQELVREKNDKTQISDSYKELKNENAALNRQLEGLNSRKISLERKLQGLQEDKNSLERRVTEMGTMLTDKVSEINNTNQRIETLKESGNTAVAPKGEKKDSVELPAIVVRPQPEAANGSSDLLSGIAKVLAVNKEGNFIIIDMGLEAGIKVGDAFKVYRGEKAIASIEVIQLRRNISACDIKREITPIKIGDTVRY